MKAAVLIVHHEGKDASRGSMGSTVIEAAVDGAARFSRVDGSRDRLLEITLLRNASDDIPALKFVFVTVDLGAKVNADGETEDVTSAVLRCVGALKEDDDPSDQLLIAIGQKPNQTAREYGRMIGKGHTTINRWVKSLRLNGLLNPNEAFELSDTGRARFEDLFAKEFH